MMSGVSPSWRFVAIFLGIAISGSLQPQAQTAVYVDRPRQLLFELCFWLKFSLQCSKGEYPYTAHCDRAKYVADGLINTVDSTVHALAKI